MTLVFRSSHGHLALTMTEKVQQSFAAEGRASALLYHRPISHYGEQSALDIAITERPDYESDARQRLILVMLMSLEETIDGEIVKFYAEAEDILTH